MGKQLVEWRRRAAWLWMIGRFLLVLSALSVSRLLIQAIDRRPRRAMDEFGYAAGPLVGSALIALLVD
jgi:hypothetical protein